VIFIDTGAFVARYVERDQYHGLAKDLWGRIAVERLPCFTSNAVLAETLTLLGRRASYPFAAAKARMLYASEALTILRTDRDDELLAVERFTKHADLHVSFVDCLSFALMEREGISRAFAFDQHFSLVGFRLYG
jgi:uncharacterized protein